MNVLSLFDGISAGQIALERAGIKYDNYFASEIDKNAIKVTQHHYPKTIQLGDIRNVYAKDLPKIDMVIGGSPCHGFSFAGKQLNFNDERSKLYFEYLRLVKECNPKYFFLENVEMKQEHIDVISKDLGVKPYRINSKLVSAQNRSRLYWTNIKIKSLPKNKNILLMDIVEPQEAAANILHKIGKMAKGTASHKNAYKNMKRLDQKASTLLAGTHRIANNGSVNILFNENYCRVPTVVECERLQTFPDNYTKIEGNGDSQRYKQLGNSWTVDIIIHFFKHINQ